MKANTITEQAPTHSLAGSLCRLLILALSWALVGEPYGSRGQSTVQQLYSFGGSGAADPNAGLIQGGDGALYGTTLEGGTNGYGTVFKIGANGTGYSELYSFTGTNGDGAFPYSGLVQGSDGALYGTTYGGGTHGSGTIFRIGTNGAGYSVLYQFTGTGGDGRYPYAGLVQGSDGALYGTTGNGGTNDYGTVFRIGTNGAGYSVLYQFTFSGVDGAGPVAGLVQGSDGALYGTTYSGGNNGNGYGTIFKIATDGTSYSVLYNFTGISGDGANPSAGLIQGNDGALYGTTSAGGYLQSGTVFRFVPPGPQLTMTISGPYVILQWPTNFTGFGVQYTTSDPVSGTPWNTPFLQPPVVSNGQFTITILDGISAAKKFYRLKK